MEEGPCLVYMRDPIFHTYLHRGNMSRVVTFVGAKGGTLKSSSVAAVGHLLAKIGRKVVLLDGDPQGDLTKRHGFKRVTEPLAVEPVVATYEGQPGVELTLFRGGRPMESARLSDVQQHVARARALEPDYILIDAPPALGVITTAVIGCADLVVVPAMPGKESLEALADISVVVSRQPEPPTIRVLITLANPQSNLYRWMRDSVDEQYPGLRMPHVVPFEMAAGESALFELPVTVSAPHSRAAVAYLHVTAVIDQFFESLVLS
jgi:chromosome partitioning protein